MKQKDSDSEVTTLCYFGARRKLHHLTNVSELQYKLCSFALDTVSQSVKLVENP